MRGWIGLALAAAFASTPEARGQVDFAVNQNGGGYYSVAVVTPFNAYAYNNAGFGGTGPSSNVWVAERPAFGYGVAPTHSGMVTTNPNDGTVISRRSYNSGAGAYPYRSYRARYAGQYAPRVRSYASPSSGSYFYYNPAPWIYDYAYQAGP